MSATIMKRGSLQSPGLLSGPRTEMRGVITLDRSTHTYPFLVTTDIFYPPLDLG
jgi:hypothetical protein